ncbi:MAG: chromosome segregation SMC family protein [Nitrososphaerales archaeon]
MVYIKKLEIRGFKSFSGLTTLTFTPNLNIITGPNGSGKTNIMDAIIFSLGENRAKALRTNKMAALIYDYGEGRAESSARVSLHLDNSDRKIALDSDSVIVTRELRSNGESIFYLNGKRVSKNSLSDLLEIALISPSNLNIIPQGLVTRLSELSPDEKRKLIEEIVGISQFDERKNQALEQLKEADMRLQIALAKIEEIRKRVIELEIQRNAQIRLKHLERTINYLKGVKISSKILSLESKLKDLEGEREKKANLMKELREKLKKAEEDFEQAENRRREFLSNFIGGENVKQVSLQGEIAKINNEIKILEASLKKAENEISELTEYKDKLYHTKKDKWKEREDLRGKIEKEEKNLSELMLKKNSLTLEIKNLSKEKIRLEKEINKLNLMVGKIREREAHLKNRLISLDKELEIKKSKREMVKNRISTLLEKEKSFMDLLAKLDTSIKTLKESLEGERKSLEEIDVNILEVRKKRGKLEEEVEKALETLYGVEKKFREFEVKEELFKALKPRELALTKLDEILKETKIEGYLGILGELIKYREDYSKAVEAAGERWLHAIIVEDLGVMVKVAELVKRLKLGPLFIIPLSEIPELPIIEAKPFGLKPLQDILEYDKKLENLVRFLFGDIILVSSLREGFLIASRGYRFVTSQGDLFEPETKAFLTGYMKSSKELFSTLEAISPEEVKKGIESLRRVINERKRGLFEMSKKDKSLTEEKIKRTIVVERLKGEFNLLLKFFKRYQRISKNLRKEITKLSEKEKFIEKIILKKEGNLKERKKKLDALLNRLNSFNLEIKNQELSKINLKKLQLEKDLEDVSNQLRETNINLANYKSNLDILDRSLKQLEEVIKEKERLLEENKKFLFEGNNKLKELRERLDKLKEEEQKLLYEAKNFREALEVYEKETKNKQRLLESVRNSLHSLEREIFSLEKEIENLNDERFRSFEELNSLGYKEALEVLPNFEPLLRELNLEYEDLRVKVNFLADSSYRSIFEGYKNLSLRRNQLEKDRDAIVRFIEDLDDQKRKIFLDAFARIDKELRDIFKTLTGGSGWLEVEDPDNLFEKGIFLMVQFPNKPPREASTVSGGEKTISTISFLLAVQAVFPSPFYLLDEIDAHLDPFNLDRLADLLKDKSKNFQLILITLKDTFIAKADQVYGVYMSDGTSKVVRYRPSLEVRVKAE